MGEEICSNCEIVQKIAENLETGIGTFQCIRCGKYYYLPLKEEK